MSLIKKIIITIFLILIPLAIGLPFMLGYKNPVILEVSYVVFGLFELLVYTTRISLKDRRLYKKKITKKEFKESTDYDKYYQIQFLLLISGLINVLLSVLCFYIVGA